MNLEFEPSTRGGGGGRGGRGVLMQTRKHEPTRRVRGILPGDNLISKSSEMARN